MELFINATVWYINVAMETIFDGLSIEFDEAKKLFVIKNSGRRSYGVIREGIRRLREKVQGSNTKFNLLIDWTEFDGFNEAYDKLLEPGLMKTAEMVSRVAFVTGHKWENEARRLQALFPYVQSNIFEPHERTAAEHWLIGEK